MTDAERIAKLERDVIELQETLEVFRKFFDIGDEELTEELRKRRTLPAPPPVSSHPPGV